MAEGKGVGLLPAGSGATAAAGAQQTVVWLWCSHCVSLAAQGWTHRSARTHGSDLQCHCDS